MRNEEIARVMLSPSDLSPHSRASVPGTCIQSDHPSVLRHVTACYESISRLEASIKCKIIFIGFKFREAFINSGKAVLEVRFEIDLMFKLLSLQFFYYIIYF